MRFDLSTAAVARELGKSPAAVIRLVFAGELSGIKVGRTYRFCRADLDAFIARARVRARALENAEADRRHLAAEWRCMKSGL
jgi:excisionase family DNA binding protein